MKKPTRTMILISCAIAALICYGLGLKEGVVGFVFAGFFFESVFWIKLLSKHGNTDKLID